MEQCVEAQGEMRAESWMWPPWGVTLGWRRMSAAFLVWVVRSITEFQKEGRAQVWGKTEAELDFGLAGFGGLRLSWRSPTVGSGVLRSGTGEAVRTAGERSGS